MRLLILASVLAVGLCMPGGYSNVNDFKSNPEYAARLQKLQTKGLLQGVNGPYEVLSVQQQVVSGMNYNYTLRIGNKVCSIIVYEQVWTDTLRVSENHCVPKDVNRQLGMPGGYSQQVLSDPMYKEMLANLSMMNLITLPSPNANGDGYKLVGVRTQVVAGINYEFTLEINNAQCKIVYYEAAWMNIHNITENTCAALTGKRQLLGGFSPVTDRSDPRFQSCVAATLDRINMRSNSMMRLVDTSISNPVQQVVAGMNYKFRVTVGTSSCRNGGDKMGQTSFGCPIADQNAQPMATWDSECYHGLGQSPKIEITNLEMAKTDVDGDKGNKNNGLLGGDTHDKVIHGQSLLGQVGHDMLQHGKQLLGADGHDFVPHGKELLNSIKTEKAPIKLLNTALKDGLKLKNAARELIGGDKHDYVQHGLRNFIGQDGHDSKPHGSRKLIGQDGHDNQPHGFKNLIGQDGHDSQPHGLPDGLPSDLGSCKVIFLEFKKRFNKLYGTLEEETTRLKIFCDNMERAKKFQQIEQGTARYGPSKFADLTKNEFSKYVGKKWDQSAMLGMKKAKIPQGRIPESFDWREHGAVTPVKNQGSCGSCWAFSTTGNIEGQWAIKKNKLISLSEQELVDCDKVDEGCNGGLPSQAYKEIERLGGLETETEYSYKGEDEKCVFKKRDVRVYINDSVSISSNETEMAQWLATNGPISIGINAFAMQFYMGGVSHPWSIFCNPSELDHGVLIVGYGVQDSKPYWIVKNSWGADWGEKGYYLVYRGAGVCGLNTMCTSAVVN